MGGYQPKENGAPDCQLPQGSGVQKSVGVKTLRLDMEIAQESPNQIAIIEECDKIKHLLLEKNKSYGDAALNPLRVFSKASPVEQIKVRIDDKLSRIAKGNEYLNEDTIQDLIGYLILYRIALKQK